MNRDLDISEKLFHCLTISHLFVCLHAHTFLACIILYQPFSFKVLDNIFFTHTPDSNSINR